MSRRVTLIAAIALLAFTAASFAQLTDNIDGRTRWEASVFMGVLTGDHLSTAIINGERATNDVETALLTGVRISAEQEFLGLETTIAAALGDSEIDADPVAMLGDGGNATNLMTNVDVLFFPAGNSWADGRIRPYLAAGPGMNYFDGDFAGDNSDLRFALNAGLGIKFLLGDQGNPVLRVDYRWHRVFGSGSHKRDMNQQEISVGLGIRF
ncbi:MAG: outer membrane beta-barrel protein [Sedimentisphaerales bacterium]|nr:outer membrane beta-barrel protein [Sedimentisphaerales bacterium]